jgi:hypothetical protein
MTFRQILQAYCIYEIKKLILKVIVVSFVTLHTIVLFREQEASLYEGLKRMTKGRLDDQRGLEINAELPEFLR